MMIQQMKDKKTGRVVDVYSIKHKDGKMIAIVFDLIKYRDTNNGWDKIPLKKLVPMDTPSRNEIPSKNRINKIKRRLKIESAIWKTSDGQLFTHDHIDDAIKHEEMIMEQEKENNVNC